MALRVLHCADLHLDAVLGGSVRARDEGELTRDEITLLRDAPLLALDALAEVVRNNEVDVVVIAGDLFDKNDTTAVITRAQNKFAQFLRTISDAGAIVAIALGNHDPLAHMKRMSASWPDNVHIFSSKSPETLNVAINGDDVALHGASYATWDESRDLAAAFPAKVSGAFNVGVLHTNVGSSGSASEHDNYAPTSLFTLTAHGYDYFALGHVHKREILSEQPLVAYSGNTQGMSPKSSSLAPKGCVLVTIDSPGGHASSEFISTDSVRYTQTSYVFDDLTSADDVVSAAIAELSRENTNSDILYLTRVTISAPACTEILDSEVVRAAINDSRVNTFVTRLNIDQSSISFDELVANDPFFSRISAELDSRAGLEHVELYGNKASVLESYVSDAEDISRDDIVEYLTSSYAELDAKGSL